MGKVKWTGTVVDSPKSAEHTPGPWATDERCEVRRESRDKQMYKVVCDTGKSDYGVDESIANARLIAAAPEMLAFIETLIPAGTLPIGSDLKMIDEARRLFAKATGEE